MWEGMVFNATFNNISIIPGKSYSTSHVCTLKKNPLILHKGCKIKKKPCPASH